MTDLSPTAKAILKAYEDSPFEYDTAELTWIAAVLRAAADQVVPNMNHPLDTQWDVGYTDACAQNRRDLLAIATELEAAARD
jgi:hypothetical protein